MARQNWGFLDPQVTMELNTPWSSTWINPGRESPVAELTQHSPLKWTIRSKWFTHCSWILQEVHLFIHLLQSLYRQRHGSRWVISAESMRGSLLFWGYHFTRLFLGKMRWNFEVELKECDQHNCRPYPMFAKMGGINYAQLLGLSLGLRHQGWQIPTRNHHWPRRGGLCSPGYTIHTGIVTPKMHRKTGHRKILGGHIIELTSWLVQNNPYIGVVYGIGSLLSVIIGYSHQGLLCKF